MPQNTTGASADALANNQAGSGGPNLPVTIGPNTSIVFLIAVNGLITQGMYTLSFGIGVDDIVPVGLEPSDGSFLIAPSAKVWTGTACQTPAMQALVPASSQDVYYVCPPAA